MILVHAHVRIWKSAGHRLVGVDPGALQRGPINKINIQHCYASKQQGMHILNLDIDKNFSIFILYSLYKQNRK